MNIIYISAGNYPSSVHPASGTFVHQNVKGLVAYGHRVAVYAPWSIFRKNLPPREEQIDHISVTYPRYPSFSNIRLFGNVNTARLCSPCCYLRMLAFKRKIRSFKPDFLFGHFLYPSGYTAHHLGKDLNVPSVLMMGESSIKSYESYPQRLMQRLLHSFRHIITVSQNLKDKTVFGYGVPSERVTYIPNGVDVTQFKPFSKSEARHRLGLDQNTCYAIFVGSFIHRKGPLRVLEAVRNYKIPIKLIFVGRGDLELSGPEVVFKGTVKHQEMPLYLAAADVFVLPTLAEGMSNAILEAMAVGLPIVTSDLDFNREFLSPETAMLVDPLNTESIAKAILAIQQEPSRQQALSEAALTLSSSYSIQNRAKKIHDILLTHYLEKKP